MKRRVLWVSAIVLPCGLGALLLGPRALLEGRADAGVPAGAADWVQDLAVSPNPVPPGRSDVFLLSTSVLLEDIALEPVTDGLVLAQANALSPQVVKLTLEVDGAMPEVSFKATLGGGEAIVTLQVGPKVQPIAVPANIPERAVIDERLLTDSPTFIYGYEGADGPDWQGIGILNETTGRWHLRRAESRPDPEPALIEVDTDGDGILDRDDPEEVPAPRPDFIGLELVEGVNHLRVLTFTKTGLASLEDLYVEYVKG